MAEFSIIERYCQKIGVSHSSTKIGVGDDAAVVRIPAGKELVISVDSMVENVHFYADTHPKLIAKKLLAVNLSDMAAMGARAKWATLALTLPSVDEGWLSAFSNSLNTDATAYGVQVIGGDTTQGPLTLSLQIMGLVDEGEALTRSTARQGDDVYLSGTIGDAGLALAALEGRIDLDTQCLAELRVSLDTPKPQVELGPALAGLASACIDVSDGLLADLGHIASASKAAIQINLEDMPLSERFLQVYTADQGLDLAITGGDDYQLAFTADSRLREKIQALANKLDIRISRIGHVTDEVSLDHSEIKLQYMGRDYQLKSDAGYQHFR